MGATMIVLLLILILLLGGLVTFFLKNGNAARIWSLVLSFLTLGVAIAGVTIGNTPENHSFSASWLGSVGSSFTLQLDGMSQLLCLLTAVAYPLILLATWKTD